VVPFLSMLGWSRHRGLSFAIRQATDSVGKTIMQHSPISQSGSNEVHRTQPFAVRICNVTSGGVFCLAVLVVLIRGPSHAKAG
jgi:hypothetical protein